MLSRSHGYTPSFRRAVARALAPPAGALHPITWTATRHLRSTELAAAVQEMSDEAARAPERKAAAGIRLGRPLQNPGLHYTLYWHTPTAREEIRRAVEDSLAVLGLDEHQAVLVGRDGPVPHVHVVVNRVSPLDGRAASLSWAGLKLSRWRRSWEHGPPVHDRDPPPAAA